MQETMCYQAYFGFPFLFTAESTTLCGHQSHWWVSNGKVRYKKPSFLNFILSLCGSSSLLLIRSNQSSTETVTGVSWVCNPGDPSETSINCLALRSPRLYQPHAGVDQSRLPTLCVPAAAHGLGSQLDRAVLSARTSSWRWGQNK